jgi:hypothetical protein
VTRRAYTKAHKSRTLGDELTAGVTAFAPVLGADGYYHAVWHLEDNNPQDNSFWVVWDDTVITPTTAQIDSVVTAHNPLLDGPSDIAIPTNPWLWNAIVNGDLTDWTRGLGSVGGALGFGGYGADGWTSHAVGAGAGSFLAITDPPAPQLNAPYTKYGQRVQVTTADASLAATDLYTLDTIIEGYAYVPLSAGAAGSFWARSPTIGKRSIALINQGADRSYVHEYEIFVADTWEYKTFVIPAKPSGGTWSNTNGIGLTVAFPMAAGSNYQTSSLDQWLSSLKYASTNQINGMSAVGNRLDIALLNIVPGQTPQPLVPLPIELQKLRIARRLQEIARDDFDQIGYGFCINGTTCFIGADLKAEMGGNFSLEISAPANYSVRSNAGVRIGCAGIAIWQASRKKLHLQVTVGSGLGAGNGTYLEVSTNSSPFLCVWNPT